MAGCLQETDKWVETMLQVVARSPSHIGLQEFKKSVLLSYGLLLAGN